MQPSLEEGAEAEEIYDILKEDVDGLFTQLMEEAALDIEDGEEARAFCWSKVNAYFQRRVFTIPYAVDRLSFSEP